MSQFWTYSDFCKCVSFDEYITLSNFKKIENIFLKVLAVRKDPDCPNREMLATQTKQRQLRKVFHC